MVYSVLIPTFLFYNMVSKQHREKFIFSRCHFYTPGDSFIFLKVYKLDYKDRFIFKNNTYLYFQISIVRLTH